MRKKTIKKMLSIALTAAMVGTMYVPAFAEETTTTVAEDTTTVAEDTTTTGQENGTTTETGTPATTPDDQTENKTAGQETESQAPTTSQNEASQEETGSEATKVAEVNGTAYESLQAAVDAAAEGAIVTLKADVAEDITIATGKNIVLDLNGKTLTNTNKGKATLQVQGTVNVKNGNIIGGTSYYNITVGKEAEKTGTATLENVTATAGNTGSSMIDNWGTLTIESGTYTGGLNVVKSEPEANLTINDGSFELKDAVSWSYTGVVMNYGNAVINNGTFKQNATSPTSACPIVVISAKDKEDDPEPHTTIVGGEYINMHSSSNAKIFHGLKKATSADFTVTGGTFNKKVTDYFFPEKYTCVSNGTEYVVADTVATVGTATSKYPTRYTNLYTAFSKATGTKTVKLMTDVDVSQKAITVSANKNTTLDLNGHVIKAANSKTGNIKVSGKLTLKDSTDTNKNGTGSGKIYTDTAYAYGSMDQTVIAVYAGGTFTMESGLIDTSSFTNDPANKGQFAVGMSDTTAKDTNIIINGGRITAGWYAIAGHGEATAANYNITVNGGILESTADYAIYHPQAGTTTINGGVVSGEAGGICINRGTLKVNGGIVTSRGLGDTGSWGDGTGGVGKAAIYVTARYGDTKALITGGTITANNDAVIVATNTGTNKAIVAISGGTFNKEVNEKYCATGYAPKANDDGTYGVEVKEGMEASASVNGTTSTATVGGTYSGSENAADNNVATTSGTVTVDVTNESANDVASSEITVDKNSLSSLKENEKVNNVVVKADTGTLDINKNALTKMETNADGADVVLKLEKEEKENELYYHVTATANGKEVYSADNATEDSKVTISVPYQANSEKTTPVVFYVNGENKDKLDTTSYEENLLSWTTSHFSTYQVELYGKVGYYKAGEEYTVPEARDYGYADEMTFAGWYADDTCGSAFMENTGDAYPKFVDSAVLSIKAQINTIKLADDKTDMRFITSVDCLDYQKVGMTITYGTNNITREVTKVYKTIKATDGESTYTYKASDLFGTSAQYVMSYGIDNIPKTAYDEVFTIQPYWVTKDGTKVMGSKATKTVQQGINATNQ